MQMSSDCDPHQQVCSGAQTLNKTHLNQCLQVLKGSCFSKLILQITYSITTSKVHLLLNLTITKVKNDGEESSADET